MSPDTWIAGGTVRASGAAVSHALLFARGGLAHRAFWGAFALVPLVGPLFYVCWREPPALQGEDLEATESDTDAED